MDRPRFRFLSIALALLISGAVLASSQDQKTPSLKSGKNSRLHVREGGSLSIIKRFKRFEILAFPFLKDLKSDYAYCSQGVV